MISDRIKYLIDFCIGDGHIYHVPGGRGGCYQYKLTHCFKQREYLFHKIGILERLGFTGRLHEYEKALNGKLFPMAEYTVHADPDLSAAEKWIINKGRKAIDKHLLSVLDERTLAYWYLDDGSPNKSNKSSTTSGNGFRYYYTYPIPKLNQFRLYTYAFTLEEHKLIIDWAKEKFDLNFLLVNCTRDGLYLKINQLVERQKFIKLVEKHIPECMKYKIEGVLSYDGIDPIDVKKVSIRGERLNEETPTEFSEEDATVQDV